MQIVDLHPDDQAAIDQTAALLVEGFRQHAPDAWPDLESALEEVRESFGPNRISRVALDESGAVIGWIGGASRYSGNVWELHPLVVRPDHQGQGIGQALVADFEDHVRGRGGLTIWLGSDDETNMTTLAGTDLYTNLFEQIANIRNLRGHPYEFYQKCGFIIVGVLPDANGPGKPDIFMAKRVAR
jgi:aminoglycoside 6'-N-acetyltransferase I